MSYMRILKKHLLRYYINYNELVILWIESFLCNKKQRVKINDFYSDWADVLSGIPDKSH